MANVELMDIIGKIQKEMEKIGKTFDVKGMSVGKTVTMCIERVES